MKYIVHLNGLDYVQKYIDLGIEHFVVGMEVFSVRQAMEINYKELSSILRTIKNKAKCYVLVNALVEQHNLPLLKEHLQKLDELGIDGVYYQDFAVLQLTKKQNYAFELVYAPDTLNTNHATLQVLASKGVSSFFLAREMSLLQKKKIVDAVNFPVIMQIHGVEYMAYSKRKLVTSYATQIEQSIPCNQTDGLVIHGANVDLLCHIYEDQYGTHIVSKRQLACIDVLDQIQDIDFGFIESMYLSQEELYQVVCLYQQATNSIGSDYAQNKQSYYDQLLKIKQDETYYHSFLFDDTVYKIADVRKREANEKG